MFSRKILARTSVCVALAALIALSLRGPDRRSNSLTLLMEPDGGGFWRQLATDFNRLHPGVHLEIVEGPPATDTREDMYSVAFLSGEASYDIVYSDVIWTPRFAAAGWLLDITDRLSPLAAAHLLTKDLEAG